MNYTLVFGAALTGVKGACQSILTPWLQRPLLASSVGLAQHAENRADEAAGGARPAP